MCGVILPGSERTVISGQMLLDRLKRLKLIEQVVLKNGVELVLEAGEDGDLLEAIDALRLEVPSPVDLLEVEFAKGIEHKVHAGDHLRLVKVRVGALRVFLSPLLHGTVDLRKTGVHGRAVDVALLCLEQGHLASGVESR